MMNTKLTLLLGLSLVGIGAGCGDDSSPTIECGAGTELQGTECVATGDPLTCGPGTTMQGNTCVPTPVTTTFVQVEQLARPGINEALLLTDAYLNGYNATAPTYAGVPTDVLNAVIGEAKTVLKAIYLGVCYTNGIAGLTIETGLHPAGGACHAIGNAVLDGTGAQTAASVTASQAYADAVFGFFVPDVMRIDTSGTSAYLTLCGGGKQLLCGGRWLKDDVIDVTYDFLLNGGLTPNVPQYRALVSDGVAFDATETGTAGSTSRTAFDPTNKQQGHPAVSNTFPYSAPPF